MIKSIQQLPSRYEPLERMLGDNARTTFFEQAADLETVKRLLVQIRSSNQSKWMFVHHPSQSGAGKTTFIHSLAVFLQDDVARVERLPKPSQLPIKDIPRSLQDLPSGGKITVVNFDQHESLFYPEPEYQSLLVQLNAILRDRSDLLVLWPVNDVSFADRLVAMQRGIGGLSAFGASPVYRMQGLLPEQYPKVLERILKVANWSLEDAALDWGELGTVTAGATNVGHYLDLVQAGIANRFDVGTIGFAPPRIAFVLSSGKKDVRDVCRNLRRADSYYLGSTRVHG